MLLRPGRRAPRATGSASSSEQTLTHSLHGLDKVVGRWYKHKLAFVQSSRCHFGSTRLPSLYLATLSRTVVVHLCRLFHVVLSILYLPRDAVAMLYNTLLNRALRPEPGACKRV